MNDSEPFLPLADLLALIRKQAGSNINRANLSARVLAGPNGRESMLERLQRTGLARTVQQGSRRDWLVSMAALPQIMERASGRPGRAPGAQITLSAEQALKFAQHITSKGTADDATILDAVRVATSLAQDKLELVERIVIPRKPRRGRHT